MAWPDWFCGTETVRFSARERRVYTSLLMRAGITAVSVHGQEDGGLSVVLRRRDLRRLRLLASERGLPIPCSDTVGGLPRLLSFFCSRPGIPIGAVLALGIWIVSTLFVWRVDVVCLDNAQGTAVRDHLDVGAVQTDLAAAGIAQGLFLPGMDTRHLENRFLIGREDISWIAINRYGTVLSVEVRPSHAADRSEEPKLADGEDGYLVGTNLVADADGRILSFSVRGGQPVVMAEEFVLRGQLLASGVYTSETGDNVAGRAHGEFMAETVRILETRVPLTTHSVQTTGKSRTAYTLCLFGKPLFSVKHPLVSRGEIVTFLETFFKNGEKTGIDGESCGIIADETISDASEWSFHLPDGLPLPVSLRKVTETDVIGIPQTLTEQEALLCAKAVLDAEEAALGAARILSREETFVREDGALVVTRYVFCVDNIAVEQEFLIKAEP